MSDETTSPEGLAALQVFALFMTHLGDSPAETMTGDHYVHYVYAWEVCCRLLLASPEAMGRVARLYVDCANKGPLGPMPEPQLAVLAERLPAMADAFERYLEEAGS